MIDTAALPDFGRAAGAGEALAYPPFAAGPWAVLPDAFTLARGPSGAPQLSLVLEKRADDLGTASQGAVLDIALAGHYPFDAALATARTVDPGATVRALPIDAGFARLLEAGVALDLNPATRAPVALGWAVSDGVRWTQRIGTAAGTLIRGAMTAGAFPFTARIEFTVLGIAPRFPVRVHCDPRSLVTAALAGRTDGRIDLDTLFGFCSSAAARALVRLDGTIDDRALGQVLVDRLFATCARLVPSPQAGDPPWIELSVPAAGSVDWNLGTPMVVPRAHALQVDVASALLHDDLASLVRDVTVPPLDLGLHRLTVSANLPSPRVGIPAIGTRVEIAANPPVRPSAISDTLLFEPPADTATADVHLAAGEALAYRLIPFTIIAAGADVVQADAPAIMPATDWVHLQASDFALRFCHVTASARLLAVATIEGELRYAWQGTTLHQPFALDAAKPDLAVAMPQGADATLTLAAVALDRTQRVALDTALTDRIALDLASIPGYGPHRVVVSAALQPGDVPLPVDLIGADGGNPTTVTLAPGFERANWGYVAASPFRAGYRWRIGSGSWTDVRDAAQPLMIGRDMFPKKPVPAQIDGVHLYLDPAQPGTVRYIPAAPVAAQDGGGHPAVSAVRTPTVTMLQVGSTFAITTEQRAAITQQLAIDAAALQPAPIAITHVGLRLTAPDGNEHEVAASSSSGFPPFNAALSVSLAPADGDRAISAIKGDAGLLFVDYAVELPAAAAATYPDHAAAQTFRSDVSAWFPGGTGAAHVQFVP